MLEGELAHLRSASHTYRRRDSPTPHAGDLEAPLLHLLVGQLDVEVELVVAGADDHLATLLREVGDAGVKLDVAVVFQSLAKMDELWRKMRTFCWMKRCIRPLSTASKAIICSALQRQKYLKRCPCWLLSWSLSPAGISAACAGLCWRVSSPAQCLTPSDEAESRSSASHTYKDNQAGFYFSSYR